MSADAILLFAVLIPSVILHEITHGWVALRFGDPTAKEAGRLTLNPVPHIDPFGTVLLPALLAFSGGAVFGWAKPVPVRPGLMRRPRDHGLVTSLAGPAMNILLAVLAALVLRAVGPERMGQALGQDDLWIRVLVSVGVINVILAAFNLIPVPPLDGSAVIERFLPERWLPRWHQMQRYSMLLVFGLVFLVPGVLRTVFDAAFRLWRLLL